MPDIKSPTLPVDNSAPPPYFSDAGGGLSVPSTSSAASGADSFTGRSRQMQPTMMPAVENMLEERQGKAVRRFPGARFERAALDSRVNKGHATRKNFILRHLMQVLRERRETDYQALGVARTPADAFYDVYQNLALLTYIKPIKQLYDNPKPYNRYQKALQSYEDRCERLTVGNKQDVGLSREVNKVWLLGRCRYCLINIRSIEA